MIGGGTPRASFRANHQRTSYRFYPVAGAAGNSSTANGCTQNSNNVKTESKIPLVKILESS